MQILAHRGFWREKNEQNTLASLAKAFEMGFGIETDLRDGGGVIFYFLTILLFSLKNCLNFV
ncbi:hypothetical protein GZ521_001197 [Campylobacter upsaliensis]|nr:hypothetical protein [Campylobacter upsaliensis]EDP6925272.1 hypothetical protein [Campylobacter upsaliensis]ELE7459142.1 hypothetical protein [Campylobacter upsaliensis]ELU9591100.1 hypothetical protein [Campylobacter upsaliensis]